MCFSITNRHFFVVFFHNKSAKKSTHYTYNIYIYGSFSWKLDPRWCLFPDEKNKRWSMSCTLPMVSLQYVSQYWPKKTKALPFFFFSSCLHGTWTHFPLSFLLGWSYESRYEINLIFSGVIHLVSQKWCNMRAHTNNISRAPISEYFKEVPGTHSCNF